MEDAHAVINDAKTHEDLASFALPYKNVSFWGVFDGHGGVDAAQMVEKHLHKNIFSQEELKGADVLKAINVGFEKTDATIVEASNKNGWMNGSTAVIGLLLDHNMYIANVGDSEAILVSENADGSLGVENCTTPHKASELTKRDALKALAATFSLAVSSELWQSLARLATLNSRCPRPPKTSFRGNHPLNKQNSLMLINS
jgi:serine/threonine protein phosphatase PrpC